MAKSWGGVRASLLLWSIVLGIAMSSGCGTSGEARTADAPRRFFAPVFREVEVSTDVQFARVAGAGGQDVSLRMDLYQPRGDDAPARPALVLIHGGGYYSGDKSDIAGAGRTFARYGYVVASMDYRLDPSLEELQKRTAGGPLQPADARRLLAAFDNAVVDSRRAVERLRSNAAALRIDPKRIATVGWSAGGSTSLGHLLVRSFDGDDVPERPDVAAVVSASGSLGGPLLDEVSHEPPPALVIAYRSDSQNSANPPSRICGVLRRAGGECDLHLRKGTGHEVDLARSAPEVAPFLAEHLTGS